MSIGKVLGSISPLYGAATGKGVFGRGLSAIADTGLGGVAPAMAQRARDKRKNAMSAAQPEGMRKGGKVKKMAKGGSASKRADGAARKGKTKGRFV